MSEMTFLPRLSIFKLIVVLSVLELVIVNFYSFDSFPFTNYPMYSNKPSHQSRYVVLCSLDVPGRVVNGSAFAPLHPGTYYQMVSRAIRFRGKAGAMAAHAQLEENAFGPGSKGAIYFDSLWIDLEDYIQTYLKAKTLDDMRHSFGEKAQPKGPMMRETA